MKATMEVANDCEYMGAMTQRAAKVRALIKVNIRGTENARSAAVHAKENTIGNAEK